MSDKTLSDWAAQSGKLVVNFLPTDILAISRAGADKAIVRSNLMPQGKGLYVTGGGMAWAGGQFYTFKSADSTPAVMYDDWNRFTNSGGVPTWPFGGQPEQGIVVPYDGTYLLEIGARFSWTAPEENLHNIVTLQFTADETDDPTVLASRQQDYYATAPTFTFIDASLVTAVRLTASARIHYGVYSSQDAGLIAGFVKCHFMG